MFSTVKSVGLNGLDGYIVNVEATIMNGLTGCEIVGLPDTAVREALLCGRCQRNARMDRTYIGTGTLQEQGG